MSDVSNCGVEPFPSCCERCRRTIDDYNINWNDARAPICVVCAYPRGVVEKRREHRAVRFGGAKFLFPDAMTGEQVTAAIMRIRAMLVEEYGAVQLVKEKP